jgi:hypothetical protein
MNGPIKQQIKITTSTLSRFISDKIGICVNCHATKQNVVIWAKAEHCEHCEHCKSQGVFGVQTLFRGGAIALITNIACENLK